MLRLPFACLPACESSNTQRLGTYCPRLESSLRHFIVLDTRLVKSAIRQSHTMSQPPSKPPGVPFGKDFYDVMFDDYDVNSDMVSHSRIQASS